MKRIRKIMVTFLCTTLLFGLSACDVNAQINTPINIRAIINTITEQTDNLDTEVLTKALLAYQKVNQAGLLRKPLLTIIDYSLPSHQKRLWVLDLAKKTVSYNTYAAHGRNSGFIRPTHFSNKMRSHESSLGVFLTQNAYYGGKGYALRMKGLEPGINDNALKRAVVIHGARYANPSFVKSHGYVGRSWGCPSIPTTLARPLINAIKGGSMIFAYYPDKRWESTSAYA